MRPNLSTAPPIAHLVGPGKLKITNGRLVFSQPDQSPLSLDLEKLQTGLCYGGVSISDEALACLLRQQVALVLLSPTGSKCLGRLVSLDDSTLPIRVGQIQCLANSQQRLQIAKEFVTAKIDAHREAARHYQRHQVPRAGEVAKTLDQLRTQAAGTSDLATLRGYEGSAAATWFELFGQLIKSPWSFTTRNRQPPRDPVNSLLSLAATWLCNRALAMLQSRGLEPTLGALHEYRSGRPALACDVIEPLRATAVDRWVVKFCNQKNLDPANFVMDPEQGCRLPEGAFGPTLAHWETWCHESKVWTQLTTSIDQLARRFRQFAQLPTG